MKRYRVYLSPLASFKLDRLLEYLQTEWGNDTKNAFLEKLKFKVEIIAEYPHSFQESDVMKGLFRCVITPQTSIYYRIVKESVEIITVIDNRQDPQEITKEIKKYFNLE